MQKKLRLNGNATVSKSKKLSAEVVDKLLEAPEGKVKVFESKLTDEDGNIVMLRGKLYKSQKGSITAKFNAMLTSFKVKIVDEVEDTKPVAKVSEEDFAKELAGMFEQEA